MPIAKNIVKEHHGKIWFTSKVGKGTKFFMTLLLKGPQNRK